MSWVERPSLRRLNKAAAHEAVAATRDGVPEKTTAPAETTDASADDPADLQTLLGRKLIATGGRNNPVGKP